jgi:hypothetical protein
MTVWIGRSLNYLFERGYIRDDILVEMGKLGRRSRYEEFFGPIRGRTKNLLKFRFPQAVRAGVLNIKKAALLINNV